MPGYPLPTPRFVAFANGRPLANGRLRTMAAGTDELLPTYTSADLSVENENPVILDSEGRASVYVPGGVPYKLVLETSSGALVWSEPSVLIPSFDAPPVAPGLPPGVVVAYGGDAAPATWVLCDGAAYPRADPLYAALFGAIGTKFGAGNGSTTFNVPNTIGKFLLGKAASGTGSVIGQTGGSLDHVHTGPAHAHNIAAHTHTVPAHTHSVPRDGWGNADAIPPVASRLQAGGSGAGSEAVVQQATVDNTTGASTAQVTSALALVTDSQGTGNTGSANPPFIVTQMIIKL